MLCPKCENQVFLTAFTNDTEGESITSFYTCPYCKIELTEDEVLDESISNNIEDSLEY